MTIIKKLTLTTAAIALTASLSGAMSTAEATAGNQLGAQTTSPPKPGKFTAKPGTAKDIYCGGSSHVACGPDFFRLCELIGGHPSKPQPWGGQTCYHPTKHD